MQVIYSILTSDITNQDDDTFNTWFELLCILNKRIYPRDFPDINTRQQLNSTALSLHTENNRCKFISASNRNINLSLDKLLTLDTLNDLCLFGEIHD